MAKHDFDKFFFTPPKTLAHFRRGEKEVYD